MQISWGLTMKKDIHIYIYINLCFNFAFPDFPDQLLAKNQTHGF